MRGLLAPLAFPVYRSLWLASLASNLGTLMQAVGVAWVMTSLTTSPLLVAMVPVAALSPTFLFGLLGGALADALSRRKVLLCTQSWMALCALSMGGLVWVGAVSPSLLLVLTFALGLGNAINVPTWQSLVQDLVPREHVPAAVALNSMSFNTGRLLGPVLGGIIVALVGARWVFLLNSLSFLGTVLVLACWRGETTRTFPAGVLKALGHGLAYVRRAHHLRAPLIRVCSFAFFASAPIALLPLLARERMALNATQYGMLLGFYGLGSLLGGGAVTFLRARMNPSTVVASSGLLTAAGLAGLAFAEAFWMGALALLTCGFAWVSSLVNLNVSVQTSVPPDFRGRAMSVYFTSFQGSFALGALAVGSLAKAFGLPMALAVFAVLLAAAALLTASLKLPDHAPQEETV